MLPREYPAWQSVYSYFALFRDDGTWQRIHDTLRAQVREHSGRHKHPTAGALDSQSVKTTPVAHLRGFDSGKRVKGRKRHILVDTLGLLLAVVVTSAAISDPAGAKLLLKRLGGACKKLRRIWVDGTRARVTSSNGCVCISSSSCSRSYVLLTTKASSSCPGLGSWNALLPGSLNAAGSAWTRKCSQRAAKP
jgi:transposase